MNKKGIKVDETNVRLDIALTKEDVVKVKVADRKKALNAERNALDADVEAFSTEIKRAEKDFNTHATELAKDEFLGHAKAVASAMQALHGGKVKLKAEVDVVKPVHPYTKTTVAVCIVQKNTKSPIFTTNFPLDLNDKESKRIKKEILSLTARKKKVDEERLEVHKALSPEKIRDWAEQREAEMIRAVASHAGNTGALLVAKECDSTLLIPEAT